MTAKPTTSWLRELPLSPLNERPGKRTKLALIGASMLGEEKPPLDDPSWDVWGCNSLWRKHLDRHGHFRADDWWEMHPLSAQTAQELQDMQDCPVNLYVLGDDLAEAVVRNWTVYPLDKIRAAFGERDYFTVTFAYQIALAILEGYREIGLWGIELWQGTTREMRVEFPCLMWWLGLAHGRGIQITLPSYSKLLWHQHLYGYDYDEDVKQSLVDDRSMAEYWYRAQQKQLKRELDAKPRVVKIR